MAKRTQEEIEGMIDSYRYQKSELSKQMQHLNLVISELLVEANNLDDPHALIPNCYKTIEEWLIGHPFPNIVNSMIFKNKSQAYNVQLSCNTYQIDYHIELRLSYGGYGVFFQTDWFLKPQPTRLHTHGKISKIWNC